MSVRHMYNSAKFSKGSSKSTQNESLCSMLVVCRQNIKEQTNKSKDLAIQCDADVSNKYHKRWRPENKYKYLHFTHC